MAALPARSGEHRMTDVGVPVPADSALLPE